MNDWIDQIDDPRFAPFVRYDKKFLLGWGLSLVLFKLGSRRQLDCQLNTDGPEVLNNRHRLAGTEQATRPVHNTLHYFLGRIGTAAVAGLRARMVQRLIRMKALDQAKVQGRFVVAVDGPGYLLFRYPHCDHCLTQKQGDTTLYLHQALEAKLLGPADTVISLGTAFLDNRDSRDTPSGASPEQGKQDCELKALRRRAGALRREFPPVRLCLSGDGLFAWGEGFQVAQEHNLSYVYVFKQERWPAVWQDFQGLLQLCPEQQVQVQTPKGDRQTYRWVNDLSYQDTQGRTWTFTAIPCAEILANGHERLGAWVTNLAVNHQSVIEVATKGGRQRWPIENQGFNTQKTSELNLEHASSHGAPWAAYYYLLQIAHLLLQLVEKGNLLRQLAQQQGKRTALLLYGSLKNMAKRQLDSVRYSRWPEEAYDAHQAGKIQRRLDSG